MALESEHLIPRLRAQGYRITTQRRLVLDVLLAPPEGHGHYSCEEVTQMLLDRGVSIDNATVYRILQWLKDADIVAQTDVGEGYDVYSLVGQHLHHHLICLNCQRSIDVDDDLLAPLRDALRQQYGFHARIEHFAIFGICEACKATLDDRT